MLRASRDDNSIEDGGSSCEESSVDDETGDMINNGTMDDDDNKAMKLHKQWKRIALRLTKLDKENVKAIALLALVVVVFLRLGHTTNSSSPQTTTNTMHSKSLRIHGPDTTEGPSKGTKSKHSSPIDEEEDTIDPTANTGGGSNNFLSNNNGGYLANGGGLGLMGSNNNNNQFAMPQQNFMQPGLMQQQGLATQQALLQQQQQQQAAAMMQQQQQQQTLLQQHAQKQLEDKMRMQQEAFQKQQEAILQQQQQQQQQLLLQQMQNPQQQQQQPMGMGMLNGQQMQQGNFNMANFGGFQQQQPQQLQQQNGLTLPGGAGANSLLSNNQFMGQAGMTMPQQQMGQQMGQFAQFGGSMDNTGSMTGTTGLMADNSGTAGLVAGAAEMMTGGATTVDPMAQAMATGVSTSGAVDPMAQATAAGASATVGGADPMAQVAGSQLVDPAAAGADPMAQVAGSQLVDPAAAGADPMAQVAGSQLVDPAAVGRPSDADMAQVAAEIPLDNLANFRDSWAPYSAKDIPIYFHIPKAGGSTVKDVIGSCLRMVMASEFGVTDGHDKDTEIAIVYPKVPGGTGSEDRSPFINVDTTTVAGIDRAAKMGFADSGLAGCVVTPFLYESNALFTPTAQGRLFAVFRHPVDRAVSMFYYIQVATWEPSYMPELQSWTLEQYATSTVIENNWMTRFLSNHLSGDLEDSHLKIAMEVIRRKFMVGLMNQLPASMTRFEKFYRLKYHVNPTNQEICRERLTAGGSNSNSKNKKEKPKKGEPLWDLIAAQNLFDIQLYEYIESLFVEQEAFVADIPNDFRNIDATCCKCDPPTFPPEGFACPKKVLNE